MSLAGSSVAAGSSALMGAETSGSEGIVAGSGAVTGSAGSLGVSEPPPNRRFNQLDMRGMLQGRSDACSVAFPT